MEPELIIGPLCSYAETIVVFNKKKRLIKHNTDNDKLDVFYLKMYKYERFNYTYEFPIYFYGDTNDCSVMSLFFFIKYQFECFIK